MPIIVNLDVMMAKRKMSLNELSEKVGLTLSNLSILKTSKAKAIRFSTLEAICNVLDCQPDDILEYKKEYVCYSCKLTLNRIWSQWIKDQKADQRQHQHSCTSIQKDPAETLFQRFAKNVLLLYSH